MDKRLQPSNCSPWACSESLAAGLNTVEPLLNMHSQSLLCIVAKQSGAAVSIFLILLTGFGNLSCGMCCQRLSESVY